MASHNVRKLPSGRYQVRYTYQGIRKNADRTFPTKADANAWLNDTLANIGKGAWLDPKAGKLLFGEYAKAWIEGRTDLSPRTQELYRQQLDSHLLPTFGEVPLSAITPSMVRSWRDALPKKILAQSQARTHPRADVNGNTAAAKAYRLLAQIMRLAVDEELIPRSPCKVKGGGKETAPERKTVSLAELEQLMEKIPERHRIVVLLAIWCQLRHGEILGLRRGSVDLERGTVKVIHSRTKQMSGDVIEKAPKTGAGRREIAVPPNVLPFLEEHIARFVEPDEIAHVVTGEMGGPLHPGTFYKTWHKARLSMGRPELRLHDLRHTGLTLFAQTGATTAELMYRAGHSTPTAAMRYQHASLEGDQKRAKAMAELSGHEMGTKPDLRIVSESYDSKKVL